MRSNSGKSDGRNNMHDPTARDHERARGHSGTAAIDRQEEPSGPEAKQRTTEMGSHARNTGQAGHGSHR